MRRFQLLKLFGILFLVYLLIYLWLKGIDEISGNAVSFFENLNDILLLVIITGLAYYLYKLILTKTTSTKEMSDKEDIFFNDHTDLKIGLIKSLFISFLASLVVGFIVYNKLLSWYNYQMIVVVSASILTFFTIFYSLRELPPEG